MWFDSLNFRAKFALSFVVCSGVLLAALLYCALQIGGINALLAQLTENSVDSLQAASRVSQLRLR